MIKVLVFGMSGQTGGIESVLINSFRSADKDSVRFDFIQLYDSIAYEDELKASGAQIFKIARRGKNPFKNRSQLKAFFNNHNDYDFVWFNQSSASNITPVIFAKKYTNAKIVTHSHGVMFESKGIFHAMHMFFHKRNQKKLCGLTDVFYAPTIAAGKWLFGDENVALIKVVKNKFYVEEFSFSTDVRQRIRESMGIQNKLVLGTVGRFCGVKNQHFTLRVFANLIKLHPESHLIMAGDGETLDNIKSVAAELGLSENISFTGAVENINELYQAMDVFIMPSLFEGLGIAAIEAQASGLHCLLSTAVPKETGITENCEFISLKESSEHWADRVLKNSSYDRKDNSLNVISAGYDIKTRSCELFFDEEVG